MRIFIAILAIGALVGCEKTETPAESPDSPPDTPVSAPAKLVATPTIGPKIRIAAPHKIIEMRLQRSEAAGTLELEEGEATTLDGIGINRCQTGFMLQGFYKKDAKLVSTPPFLIRLAEVPIGRAFEYTDPNVKDSTLRLNFTTFGLDHAAGEVSVVDNKTQKTRLKMVFDAEPTTVATAPGIGPQGCYSTGYYHVDERQGPVVAVWDGSESYYVGMQLTQTQSLTVEFAMRGSQRRPENLIQASLARVFEKPESFPFRVNFETREDAEPVGSKTGPQLILSKIPIEKGTIRAVFRSSSPEGPIRIELTDIEIPQGYGELSGKKVSIKTEALFVSDLKGRRVPIPMPPIWKTVEAPDAN